MFLEKCAIPICIIEGQLPFVAHGGRINLSVENPNVLICANGLVTCWQRVQGALNKIRAEGDITIVKNHHDRPILVRGLEVRLQGVQAVITGREMRRDPGHIQNHAVAKIVIEVRLSMEDPEAQSRCQSAGVIEQGL